MYSQWKKAVERIFQLGRMKPGTDGKMYKPTVIIIGAGFTGVATAYDLAMRGFAVTVVERGELASGTSGRTHGLLHSGGRYCVNDRESAIECIEENTILRKIARQCIEPNGGFFIGLNDLDLEYTESSLKALQHVEFPLRKLAIAELLKDGAPNQSQGDQSIFGSGWDI